MLDLSHPATRAAIKRGLDLIKWDYTQWARVVMYRECAKLLADLDTAAMDALEISPGTRWQWQALPFRSYTETRYPDFDICTQRLDRQFDIVIADQVFEHVISPYRAVRNVIAMLRPGGRFLVTTPFLIRLHCGVDCTRWSRLGMTHFLAECGFPMGRIEAWQWGNRACVKANFNTWKRHGWGLFKSLRNEEDFPVVVWALARLGDHGPPPV